MNDKLHFGSLYTDHRLPKDKLQAKSIDKEIAFNLIKEELELETNERQNLATFCQTYMEEEADRLIGMSLSKNAIDKTEYPRVTEIENRCLKIIESLWHGTDTIGSSTIGSSEGCILGGLNMKMRHRKAHPDNHQRLNLIISSGYQVCWEKFAVYFDIELRTIPLDDQNITLNCERAIAEIDENTIGIVGILGVTYTGLYDNIEELDKQLSVYNAKSEFPIYIHVDGASGGLYAPFIKPAIKWDFKLDNVISINTSGHKYGLTYPGVGWVLFKNNDFVESDLLFDVAYLGGEVSTMGVNFSHSASHIIAQYYNFSRFGFDGYRKIHQKTREVANYLYEQLDQLEIFEFINKGEELPILCFSKIDNSDWNLYALSEELLKSGWQVPSYELSDNLSERTVLRIVVRADLNYALADALIRDIKQAITSLQIDSSYREPQATFTH